MHFSHSETLLKLLDETNKKKLNDLYLTYNDIISDALLQNLDYLNSEIMKKDKDILKYTIGNIQTKQIIQNTNEIADSITDSEHNDENFNLETQKNFKNKSMNHLLSSQKLKKEKSGGNKINEIMELEVENSSLEWDYMEINKQNMELEAIDNFKFSEYYLSFGNIDEILEALN